MVVSGRWPSVDKDNHRDGYSLRLFVDDQETPNVREVIVDEEVIQRFAIVTIRVKTTSLLNHPTTSMREITLMSEIDDLRSKAATLLTFEREHTNEPGAALARHEYEVLIYRIEMMLKAYRSERGL